MATATDARAEYLAATQDVLFTKDFNPALEAVMADRALTHGQRFLAWLKRRSWGNQRLHAGTQTDCSRELEMDKRTVSHLVKFYELRGLLYRDGKLLYPTITPQVSDSRKKVAYSSDFCDFLEHWKVAHSSDFLELEVARSTVKRIEKVKLSLYKEWRTSRTDRGPTLYEKEEDLRGEKPPASQPNVKVEEVGAPEPEPAGRPAGNPGNESPETPLKAEIRQHLETIPIPRLTNDVVNEVAKHITSPVLLKQFKEETAPHRVRPQKWVLLIRIAAQVGADGERYTKAVAASSESPPMTALDRKAAEYARSRRKEAYRGNSS